MVKRSSAHMIPQAVENRSPEFLGTQFEEIFTFLLLQDKVLYNFFKRNWKQCSQTTFNKIFNRTSGVSVNCWIINDKLINSI